MRTVLLSTSSLWNCGDDWIREGLLRCLNLKPDVRTLWWNRGWGIRSMFANSLKVNLELSDYIIMAGTPEWIDRNEAIYRHCMSAQKPIALLGVGRTGGFLNDEHSTLMAAVARAGIVDIAITRDNIAPRYLDAWGIDSVTMCDPALFCKPLGGDRDLNIIGYRGMGLGPNDGNRHHVLRDGGPSKQLDDAMVAAFEAMDGPKVVTVHDNREIRAAEELFGPEYVYCSSDYRDMYQLYSRCRYYIGTRIHGFVPSVVHGAAAQLIYPTDKAETMDVAIERLGLEGHATVQIMGRDEIAPNLDMEPMGDSVTERLDAERELFRERCMAVDWLKDLMWSA